MVRSGSAGTREAKMSRGCRFLCPCELFKNIGDSSGKSHTGTVENRTWFDVGPARVWYPYRSPLDVVDQAKADANLIAAAPEMLECLQSVIDYLGYFATPAANELWGKVAMTIRKAHGEETK